MGGWGKMDNVFQDKRVKQIEGTEKQRWHVKSKNGIFSKGHKSRIWVEVFI